MFNIFKKHVIKPKPRYYHTPPDTILPDYTEDDSDIMAHSIDHIAAILLSCGIGAIPIGAQPSASVTQYHFNLLDNKHFPKVQRVTPTLTALLNQPVTISPSHVAMFCVTVPHEQRHIVGFKNAARTTTFNAIESPLASVLGRDTHNDTLAIDIAKMPHLLIAGTTGSGKSVLLHSIILSHMFKSTPSCLKYVMIDTKQVELTRYDGIPHLEIPVVTNVQNAITTLANVCAAMDRRYTAMRNGKTDQHKLVVVIDELADLMLVSKKAVENSIVRLAQLGRAAGIHLIIATQSPRVAVVTGLIKANMPAKIALTTSNPTESGVIGIKDSHKLAGRGDALFQGPDHTKPPIRFQGAYVRDEDISAVTAYWKDPKRHASY